MADADILRGNLAALYQRLYRACVSEWEAVEPSIAADLLNKCGNQQEPDSLLAATKQG